MLLFIRRACTGHIITGQISAGQLLNWTAKWNWSDKIQDPL